MPIFLDTLLSKKILLKKIRLTFVIFACICFCTAIVISNYTLSKKSYNNQTVPQRVGPIQGDAIYKINVTQSIPVKTWAFLEVNIETKNGQTLFSVGKELWHEQGKDSDGPWTEKDETIEYDFKLPKGEYYLNSKVTESSIKKLPHHMNIDIEQRLGSPYMMLITTIISFLIAIGLTIIIAKSKLI